MTPRTSLRRRLLPLAAGMLGILGTAGGALAQGTAPAWPNRPVRVIIPQPPGGVLDILIRALAEPLRQQLGQQIVVDNRPGGNNVVGLEACAAATPDGYTLCAVSAEVLSTYPLVEPTLYARYSSIVPVTLIARNAGVLLANPGVPVKDLRDFVTWARTQTDLNYSSSGQGSTPNLLWEYIKQHDGLRIEQVPYRGIIDAFNEMAAGRVQVSYIALGFALEPIATGRVKPLAVLGSTRSPRLPDVPSLGELGYEFPYDGPWWGFAAPANTPAPVMDRIAAATRAALADTNLRTRLLEPQAYEAVGNTPAEFAAIIEQERTRGVAIVRAAGIEAR